ncbi:MAG: CoA transferase [Microcystis sp. LE19-4.1E]|jgi:crotonobetainyl-CoA:carnitine CoA-transferase CaiB-like acyl-CoA transferase|nr:CoA transferase [Microcystis sp. LE19-4.1E]
MTFSPLKGVRVLDLTSVVVGPVATWRLAQYGAEIIKVESPEGDLMRGLGGLSPTGQQAGAYLHLNRGKRNICLDLKKRGALDALDRLIGASDVVVANMRLQALRKLGLDAAAVLKRHPGKVYCLITGYGSDGPYAGRPTYDSVVQAATGMAGLVAARDGEPRYMPMLICDHVVGEIAAGAILAAVMQARASGRGVDLEIPMFETMATFVLQEHLAQASFDPPTGAIGDQRLLSPHNKPVRTADGWIAFTINTDAQVRAFLAATGRESLIADPRFATVAARAANVREWFEVRGAALPQKKTAAWLEVFQAADIAAMPCHTLETLRSDPHLREIGFFKQQDHPTEGPTIALRSALTVNGGHPSPGFPAQARGEETTNILSDLGFQPSEIAALISSGAAVGHLADRSLRVAGKHETRRGDEGS